MTELHHNHHHHHQESFQVPNTENMTDKKLLWVSLLNLSITLVQIVGGLLSNSLSLVSDALHNLGDTTAFFIAFIARKIARKQANEKHTFGYNRIEILAALLNSSVLLAICIFICKEAIDRLINIEPIQDSLMFSVAIFGLLANFLSIVVLNKEKNANLNLKAAYLHLLGDTISSVVVIVAAIGIWIYKIYWIDPIISILVCVYIIIHTYSIVKDTVSILIQSTPKSINLNDIKFEIEKIYGIDNIHHLHVWMLDDMKIFFEAHLNFKNDLIMSEMMIIRENVENVLEEKFGIFHVTLQTGYNCCNGNNELINK